MRRIKFFGILRYKHITQYRPEGQTVSSVFFFFFSFININNNKKLADLLIWLFQRITEKNPKKKKIDKYFNLGKQQKKQWNMKVMVRQFVVCLLGMVAKGLKNRQKELEIRKIDIIQTTALLRLAKEIRRVQETREELLSPWLQWKTPS